RNERVAHLVISNPAAFLRREDPALFFDSGNDAFDCRSHIVECDTAPITARSHDRRFIYEIGDIGACESRRHRGNPVEIKGGIEDYPPHMDLEDLEASFAVWPVDQHLAVEAPGPQQSGIEDFRPICGAKQNDTGRRIEAIELGEELI